MPAVITAPERLLSLDELHLGSFSSLTPNRPTLKRAVTMALPRVPIASTSRIPYGSPSPAGAAARTPSTTPTRTFCTSRPSPSPRAAHRHAHLIHPLARQRLTNVVFTLAGVLSVVTVSLGMSGSLGSAGVRPGCPARKEAAVALQGDRGGQGGAGAGGAWKGKGRFLDDPVVPVAPGPAVARPGGAAAVVGRAEEAPPREERGSSGKSEPLAGVDARIQEPAPAPANKGAGGWRAWVGASERVV